MISENQIKYVLDSNIFIEASRNYYPFDLAKPFWEGLMNYARMGIVCSIDKVYDELILGDDELSRWAKNSFFPYFMNTETLKILTNYSTIINWAQNQEQFSQQAKDEFYERDNADTWIIAFALTSHLTVVTHETIKPEIRKKIPIPNVCKDFKIPYIGIFEMLRNLNFHF